MDNTLFCEIAGKTNIKYHFELQSEDENNVRVRADRSLNVVAGSSSMLPKLKPVALTLFMTRKYTLVHFRMTLYSHDTSGN